MNQYELLASAVVAVQAVSTAWLTYLTRRNSCGGTRCQETMIAALKLTTGRLNGIQTQQQMQDARWHSPES